MDFIPLNKGKMEEKVREVYKIAKFRFNTLDEYLAGQRDVDKIAELDIKKTMNYADVSSIAKRIRDEEIIFESKIGEAFVSSLNHRLAEYHKLIVKRLLGALCYAVIAGCITFFLVTGFLEYRSQRALDMLKEKLNQEIQTEEIEQELNKEEEIGWLPQQPEDETSFSEVSKTVQFMQKPVEQKEILTKFREIYKENNYFMGWLKIEGTGIDYPVMYGPDNEYYLSHNIEDQYDKNGMLILDVGCDLSIASTQYIIYGHNVQSGRMFGELLNYKDKAYWQFHPMISFDTLTEETEYEIISVFLVSLDEESELAEFYNYKTFYNEQEFETYLNLIKNNSLYETGVMPVYGAKLLTLVTCDNSIINGRLVVVATEKKQ